MSTPEFLPLKNVDGVLTLDVRTEEGVSRLRTVAPFEEAQVIVEPTYSDQGREVEFGPGYIWHPPTLKHVDLTVRVRPAAGSTPDSTLYQMLTPDAETIEQTIQRVIDNTEHDTVIESESNALVAELMAELRKRGHVS